MAATVALVILILQIASSRCRIITRAANKHVDFNNDDATHDVTERISPDSLDDHHEQFNEIKKYLKVIPFKENGDLKNDTKFLRDHDEKDYPVAVILASRLEENMRDNLKRININDYLTEIIKNSYKFDKNKDVKTKMPKQPELAIDANEEILQRDETKLDAVKLEPTVVSNDVITDLESITSVSDIDVKNILDNLNIKPTDTKLNKSMEDGGHDTNSNDVTPDNDTHKSVLNTKGTITLDETKLDEHKTLQEDDDVTVNDVIESIVLDELSEQTDADGNHSEDKVIRKSPERQMVLSWRDFNVTEEDFVPSYYSMKFVFNL